MLAGTLQRHSSGRKTLLGSHQKLFTRETEPISHIGMRYVTCRVWK